MKKIITTLLVAIPLFVSAQNNSGEVIYEESMKLEISFDEEGHMEAVKSMLPSEQKSKTQLVFNSESSIYRDYDDGSSNSQDLQFEDESSGGMVKMVIERPENILFRNISAGTSTRQQSFFGRTFLVQGNAKQTPWKLSSESKSILGYTCQKATVEDSIGLTEAWFTTEIPASVGPDSFGSLPGLILEVIHDDGKRTFKALSVDLKDVKSDQISAPKKGKKVTQEEFSKIVKEKMAEMEETMGGEGEIIIKTRSR